MLLVTCFWLPSSPKWLARRGRWSDASNVLRTFKRTSDPHVSVLATLCAATGSCRFSSMFSRPMASSTISALASPLLAHVSCGAGLMQLFADLCARCGAIPPVALAMSWVQYAVWAVFAMVPMFALDRCRRKDSMIFGFIVLAAAYAAMFALTIAHASRLPDSPRFVHTFSGLPASAMMALFLFTVAVHSATIAVSSTVHCTEAFPFHARSKGTALAMGAFWCSNAATTVATPLLVNRLHDSVFLVFACLCALSAVTVLSFPETRADSHLILNSSSSSRKTDSNTSPTKSSASQQSTDSPPVVAKVARPPSPPESSESASRPVSMLPSDETKLPRPSDPSSSGTSAGVGTKSKPTPRFMPTDPHELSAPFQNFVPLFHPTPPTPAVSWPLRPSHQPLAPLPSLSTSFSRSSSDSTARHLDTARSHFTRIKEPSTTSTEEATPKPSSRASPPTSSFGSHSEDHLPSEYRSMENSMRGAARDDTSIHPPVNSASSLATRVRPPEPTAYVPHRATGNIPLPSSQVPFSLSGIWSSHAHTPRLPAHSMWSPPFTLGMPSDAILPVQGHHHPGQVPSPPQQRRDLLNANRGTSSDESSI